MAVERLPFLAARKHELDRPSGLARERRRDRLDPHERLRTERAAHRQADEPDPLLGHAERVGEVRAHVERRLRPCPELELVAAPACDTGVRLHLRVLRAGDAVGALHDHVGLGEARLDVAVPDREPVADVRARLRAQREVRGRPARNRGVVDERRARPRGLDRVVDRGQLLVVDLDERHGSLGLRRRRSGDRRDRIPGVARAIEREHRLVLDLATVRAEPSNVVGREHDAGVGHRRGVDPQQPRMRVERADDPPAQQPGQLEVLRVAGGTGHARIGHAAMSSTARRTSTAITRRRYSDDPLTSPSGSIASA